MKRRFPDAGAKIKCPKYKDAIFIKKPEPSELAADMLTEYVESESSKVEIKNKVKSGKTPSKKSEELIGNLLLAIPIFSSILTIFLYATSTDACRS